MKRKLSIAGKYTSMILSGAALVCLLSSCAGNDKSGDYEIISVEVEAIDLDETGKEEHSRTESPEEGQEEASVNVSDEQGQTSADASKEQEQVPTDADNGQPNDSSIEKDGQLPLSLEESYKAVLLDNGDFISTDMQNRKINLTNIKEAVTDDDSITVAANKFAIIDLNGDGENEVILWLQVNGVSDFGFEVLRYREGSVYGYTLSYREFMELKADGTFLFSGGAADSGIGKLSFSENGYTIDKLYYSESQYNSNNELEVQYIANGTPYSEEEFNNDMRNQEDKDNVRWHELTTDNVRNVFEQ